MFQNFHDPQPYYHDNRFGKGTLTVQVRALRNRIQKLYFERKPRFRPRKQWEAVIVNRRLSANRNRINVIDVEEAGDYSYVIRRLRDYLKDPESLLSKVHNMW